MIGASLGLLGLYGRAWPCHRGPERRGCLHSRFGLVQADTGRLHPRLRLCRGPGQPRGLFT